MDQSIGLIWLLRWRHPKVAHTSLCYVYVRFKFNVLYVGIYSAWYIYVVSPNIYFTFNWQDPVNILYRSCLVCLFFRFEMIPKIGYSCSLQYTCWAHKPPMRTCMWRSGFTIIEHFRISQFFEYMKWNHTKQKWN